MTISDILKACSLCPGLCRIRCPIYSASRDLRAAPDRLGLAGLYVLEHGDNDLLYNLELCTGCKYCVDNCPIKNDLPRAIFKLRTLIPDVVLEDEVEKYKKIHLEGLYLALDLSTLKLDTYKLNQYGFNTLDTSTLYRLISYGYEITLEGSGRILTEDLDVFPPSNGAIELSIMYDWGRKEIGEYILHIPCKAREYTNQIIERACELFGKPLKTIVGCTGSGGFVSNNYPDLSIKVSRMLVKRLTHPVVTLCIHSLKTFKSLGLDAYTPASIYLGEDVS